MSDRAQLEWNDISVAAVGSDPDKLLLEENSVSWSYSKRSNLEQCARRYYYEYYGASTRHASSDPNKTRLRKLACLQNRYERSGEIAHHLIATALRNATRADAFNVTRLEQEVRNEWRKAVETSQQPVNSATNTSEEISRLIEVVRPSANGDTLLADTEDRLVRAIRNFATSDQFAVVRTAARDASARIERRFSIRLHGRPVMGIVDFAAYTKESPGIVDWKTGAVDPGEDSLQLSVYAVWAGAEYQVPAATVRVFKADLAVGQLVAFELTPSIINAAKARILLDLERIAHAHAFGINGIQEAFAPSAHRRVCELCPFLEVCHEGMEVMR